VLARAAHATGIPMMRHPFLLHPKDPQAWAVESAFYLGPSLWAAPVVARNERTKKTWLPPGSWVDLDDFAVYEGGKPALIPAPLAKLPLLIKDGGIVPMLDAAIDTLAPATEPTVITLDKVKDRLDVVVALSPGRDARITLVDGTELVAKRVASDAGPPTAIAAVAPEQLVSCPGACFHAADAGGVRRLRITTPLETASRVAHDDVVLEARGPIARRVRWDVLRLR
jgi:alpha-D-xyloside xylohydrolase